MKYENSITLCWDHFRKQGGKECFSQILPLNLLRSTFHSRLDIFDSMVGPSYIPSQLMNLPSKTLWYPLRTSPFVFLICKEGLRGSTATITLSSSMADLLSGSSPVGAKTGSITE
jgi:hypothetical protein